MLRVFHIENKSKLTMDIVQIEIKNVYMSIFATSNMFADAVVDSILKSGYEGMEEFHEFALNRIDSELGPLISPDEFMVSLMAKHVAENSSLNASIFGRDGVTDEDFKQDFLEQYRALKPAFEEEVPTEIGDVASRSVAEIEEIVSDDVDISNLGWAISSTSPSVHLIYDTNESTDDLDEAIQLLQHLFASLDEKPSDLDFAAMLTLFDGHIMPNLESMRGMIKMGMDKGREYAGGKATLLNAVGDNLKFLKNDISYTIIKEPIEGLFDPSYTVIMTSLTQLGQSMKIMTIGEIYDELGYDMKSPLLA